MINKILLYTILFTLIFSLEIQAQKLAADLAIISAKIHTADKAKPKAEAIAIVGNKIVAVGTSDEIRKLIGENTKIIDAKGKLVLPGFNDSHVHFMGVGNNFFSIDLRSARTPSEVVEKLEYYTRFLAKDSWILGGQWNNENWTPDDLPTKDLIDKVTPEHPVFIYNSKPDTVLVNSVALKYAGINKDTKNVDFGEIVRDESGEPTGILRGRAINLVRKVVPILATEDKLAVAETASNYAASFGVTSVQDVHSDNNVSIFQRLFQEGKLKTRVYDCISLPKWKKMAEANIKQATGDAMVRTGCLKHFSDGDYAILPELAKEFLAADKADLQITVHAIGSRANEIILTAFERVLKENGNKDRRFMIEHAHNVRPQDLARFSKSKIIASMQPYLFYGDEPYRTLLNSKATLAFGSDAPMTDINPLLGIYAAVNVGSQDEETISVEEAVYAYTMGSAYAEFQENVKGSITVGKLADLVILSDDIFTIKPENIRNTKVLTTIVDGKIVFERK